MNASASGLVVAAVFALYDKVCVYAYVYVYVYVYEYVFVYVYVYVYVYVWFLTLFYMAFVTRPS